VTERILRVGRPTPLVGIVSEPDAFDASRPAVLLLNSGIMHRVGTCRLSVKLARAVAQRGLLAARFDFSGIGDSEPRRGSESFERTAPQECIEVMDYLQRTRGVSRFILYGLCSGSDASYFTALQDERVVAIAQIDAFCYPTMRYYAAYYAPLVVQGSKWQGLLRRAVRTLTGGRARAETPSLASLDPEYVELPTYTRIFPPRDVVADGLRTLVARRVPIFVTFTGSEAGYRYTAQFRDSFRDVPFGDLLRVDYLRHANHIVTQPDVQRQLVDGIADWMAQQGVARVAGEATRVA
jgi:hypothetical protein